MPQPYGVTVGVLEERLRGVREDVTELVMEQGRIRTRLHNLEGVASAFLEAQRVAREREERQYRNLEVAVKLLGLVVACAAVVVPIIVAILATR